MSRFLWFTMYIYIKTVTHYNKTLICKVPKYVLVKQYSMLLPKKQD